MRQIRITARVALLLTMGLAVPAAGSAEATQTAARAIPASSASAAAPTDPPVTLIPLTTDPNAPKSKPGFVTVGIAPAGSAGLDQRPFFAIGATPGAHISDHVSFLNYSTSPLDIAVYATDALDTTSGTFSLLPANRAPKDSGSWIKLATTGKLHLPARTQALVPFSLTVPTDASPGDHSAGIVASISGIAQNKGAKVKLDQRVGSRVYVRVSGPLKPGLAIVNVKAHWHGTLNPIGTGSVDVTYGIRNTGNVRLGARQAVRLSGLFGGVTLAKGIVAIPEVLPGSTINQTAHFSGVWPQIRFTVKITATPVSQRGSADPSLSDASKTVHLWAIPWTLLAIVLVLLLLAVGLWRRRRRRRARDARPHGPAKPNRATTEGDSADPSTDLSWPDPPSAG
jgi:hypothetical protein